MRRALTLAVVLVAAGCHSGAGQKDGGRDGGAEIGASDGNGDRRDTQGPADLRAETPGDVSAEIRLDVSPEGAADTPTEERPDAPVESAVDAPADAAVDSAGERPGDVASDSAAVDALDAAGDTGGAAGADASTFVSAQHVHIYISNFCEVSTSPTSFTVPTGQTLRLSWHNHSVDYEADVWLSYGGGYLGLPRGSTWDDPFQFCASPGAYTASADVSIAGGGIPQCPKFTVLINCQ